MMYSHARRVAAAVRSIHSRPSAPSYHLRYADKLKQMAQDKGLDFEELKLQAREEARRQQKIETATLLASFKKAGDEHPKVKTSSNSRQGPSTFSPRRDSSPIKPLSSILNLTKLLATPHTSSQISALWTTYHASRNQGTGRGYICASLPLETYNTMMHVAKKYPVFVAPVPRESPPDSPAVGTAHEFYFLQWDFHPVSSATKSNTFDSVSPGSPGHLPQPSTVLFTPLQEYKLRASFATPYLVLTFYTDLSQSHGIVLLHGEITPCSTSTGTQPEQALAQRFLLSQMDAQLLAMALQRFYLWGGGEQDTDLTAKMLLKQFHEKPEEFNWQDLLKFSNTIS